MSDGVLIALITAIAGLLGAVLVELIRTRRRADRAATEVAPNGGGSLRDAVDRIEAEAKAIHRIEAEAKAIRITQTEHSARLAAVEARLDERARWATRGG